MSGTAMRSMCRSCFCVQSQRALAVLPEAWRHHKMLGSELLPLRLGGSAG